MPKHHRQTGFGGVAVRALGLLLLLIGVVLIGGGAWLLALGGSAYYLVAGIALVISGALIAQLKLSGAALYAAVFLATVLWAIWEVGPKRLGACATRYPLRRFCWFSSSLPYPSCRPGSRTQDGA
jgi:hypothetical protein